MPLNVRPVTAVKAICLSLGLVGFLAWITGGIARWLPIAERARFPLGAPTGIAVDSRGYVVCGSGFYGRVQVYDSGGKFLTGWYVDSSGGDFRLWLTEDETLCVASIRGNVREVFRLNGERLSHASEEAVAGQFDQVSPYSTTGLDGRKYIIRESFGPTRVFQLPDRVIVRDSWLLWIVRGPFPAFLIAVVGFLGLGIVRMYSRLIA
jgi:hypothetical protein